jgi:hypothetical protein
MRDQLVDCLSLGDKVQLHMDGFKKIESRSADMRKLRIMPEIKNIIKTATKVVTKLPYDALIEPHVIAYHILKNTVILDNEALNVRLVIKETDLIGKYHYDHTVHAVDNMILDSIHEKSPPFDEHFSSVALNGGAFSQSETPSLLRRTESLNYSLPRNNEDVKPKLLMLGDIDDDATDSDDGMVLNLFIDDED